MKKIKNYAKNLPIKELFDTLDAKRNEQKKVIAIAGKINTKKTRLLNSIYEYKKNLDLVADNENLTYFEKTIRENSLSSKAEKENKEKLFAEVANSKVTDESNNKPNYKNITAVSAEHFIEDIGRILRNNVVIENTHQWKYLKWVGKLYNKYLIKKVLRKITELESDWKKSVSSNKAKMIFPVLTTISTMGTSIGVPVLSVGLFRQDEIIQTISWGGYIGVLVFCAVLIGIGIIAIIAYLFSVVFVNKTDYLVQNLSDGYIKLISKYFVLPSQDESKTKNVWKKIKIKKSYNLFYNEIYYTDPRFDEYMKLMMVLHALNNNIIFTLNVNEKFEFKQIFSSQWGSSNNYIIFDVESYKSGFTNNYVVSFLIDELSKSLDFDTNNFYRRNKNFSIIIDTFCEMSNHNLQLLEFLNTCKNLFKNNFNNLFNTKSEIKYLLDLFSLISFKSLNNFDFIKLAEKIKNEFELVDTICDTYSNLKIKEILTSNWKTYGVNSLTQNIENIYEDKNYFSTITSLPSSTRNINIEKQENDIVNFFINKKFEKLTDKKIKNSSFEMANKDGDQACIFTLNQEEENFDIFNEIKKIKEKCLNEDILFIAINLGDYYLIFQQTVGKYQLISNS